MIQERGTRIEELLTKGETKDQEIAAKGRELANKVEQIAAKERTLADKDAQIQHFNDEVASKDRHIHSMETQLEV